MPQSAVIEKPVTRNSGKTRLSIIGIQASPRGMGSRTRLLLQWVLAGAADAGAVTELIDLTDLHITPCTACESCSLTGTCIFNDDFLPLYQRMIEADGIVLGSPVYIDNITGQMKVFVDRLADAIHYQVLTGKYGCAVATTWSSGGGEVVEYLNHVLNYLGALTIPGMHLALKDDEQAIYRARHPAEDIGKDLVQAINTRKRFPDQDVLIEQNRAFFAGIVIQNREWRPKEYREWVTRGWIR